MKLRNYIVGISLLAAGTILYTPALGCGPEAYRPYSYSPFLVINPLGFNGGNGTVKAQNETSSFWSNYTNGVISEQQVIDYFDNATSHDTHPETHSALIEYLERNNDRTAIQYIADCMEFNDLSRDFESDGWDYTDRDSQYLQQFALAIEKRNGGKIFSPRYNLLKMRIAGLLHDDETVMKVWKSVGQKLAPGALRDRMGGFVGGVLYRHGKYPEALDYFTACGDYNSITWCVSKLLGPANLRQLYKYNPNSDATLYVLNDYLNFLISGSYAGRLQSELNKNELDEDIIEAMRSRNEFIDLCDEVLADGRADNQMAWALAKGAVELTLGNTVKGLATIQQAKTLKGTDTAINTLENFELWTLLLNSGKGNEDIDRKMIASLDKLYAEAVKECKDCLRNHKRETIPTPRYTFLTTFFNEEAKAHYNQLGQPRHALAIMAMMEDLPIAPVDGSGMNQREMREMIFRTLSDTDALSFVNLAQNGGDSILDKYLAKYASKYLNLANEAYGTRLLVRYQFEKALKYLDEVDVKWIPTMAIYPYLRRYHGSGYYDFSRKYYCGEFWSPYYPENVKAIFCRDMIELLKGYDTLKGDEKAQAAYEIASLYHQGSPSGVCWAISDYKWSICALANEFNNEAEKWLQKAWTAASDPKLKCKISYAILANPVLDDNDEALFAFGWKDGYGGEPMKYYWNNRSIQNERAVSYLMSNYSIVKEDYTMGHCDVLKDYAASRFVAKPTY